jgi:uncharacterized protein YciI
VERGVTFTVVYRRGPRWDAELSFREQPGVAGHARFLSEQLSAGRLRLGGPFADDTGGVALYDADDASALDAILRTDPTIVSGLMEFELHPTIVALERAPVPAD